MEGTTALPERACPHCGVHTDTSAEMCPNCGKSLGVAADASAVEASVPDEPVAVRAQALPAEPHIRTERPPQPVREPLRQAPAAGGLPKWLLPAALATAVLAGGIALLTDDGKDNAVAKITDTPAAILKRSAASVTPSAAVALAKTRAIGSGEARAFRVGNSRGRVVSALGAPRHNPASISETTGSKPCINYLHRGGPVGDTFKFCFAGRGDSAILAKAPQYVP